MKENGIEDLIQNPFGVSESLNWYSWFVALYIFCMIILPLISRWLDKKPILATIGFTIAFYAIEVAIHALPMWESNKWLYSLFNNCMLMRTVLLGYYCAKQQVFQKIRIPRHWAMALVGVLLIVLALVGYALCGAIAGVSLFIIYAPIAILGILLISHSCRATVIKKVLISLGNLSVYMWFFHALFFTDIVRSIYQPFILVSDNIFIITIWTILLTYLCSSILKWIVDRVENSLNKIFNNT